MPNVELMQWSITADKIGDGADVGRIGPEGATLTQDEIVNHPDAVAFRMYDDDGELYYEGFIVRYDNEDDEALFAPLDDFGGPNSGCAYMTIKNKQNGKWEVL